MVECLTLDRRAAGSSLTGVTARHIYPSLVLVLSRKNRPYITERLLMGRKESNQTNKILRNYFEFEPVIQEEMSLKDILCNFGRRHHEEQFCEIILILYRWFRRKCL